MSVVVTTVSLSHHGRAVAWETGLGSPTRGGRRGGPGGARGPTCFRMCTGRQARALALQAVLRASSVSRGPRRCGLLRRAAQWGHPMSFAFGEDDSGQAGGSGSSWLRCDLQTTRPAGRREVGREPCSPGSGLVNATGENRVEMGMHPGAELLSPRVFL